MECTEGVVYSIPLFCGNVNIGQSGQRINERMREYRANIRNGTGSNLALHVRQCTCTPDLEGVTIVGHGVSEQERELQKAFLRKKRGQKMKSRLKKKSRFFFKRDFIREISFSRMKKKSSF